MPRILLPNRILNMCSPQQERLAATRSCTLTALCDQAHRFDIPVRLLFTELSDGEDFGCPEARSTAAGRRSFLVVPTQGEDMKPFIQPPFLLSRLLPILLLPAALIGLCLAAKAQQATSSATPALEPPPALARSKSPTPEGIGDSMLVKRRYQEAIEAYKNASNDSYYVWNKRGIAYQMLSDLKDAERCYKQSLRLNPDFPWAMNNLGSVYDAQGDFKKSEILYRKALALEPTSARIAANLGTSLMFQNKFGEGSEIYKRALVLDPDVLDRSEGPVYVKGLAARKSGAVSYYKAKGCAQAGIVGRAIGYLEKALHEGFTTRDKIAQDSSFASLRGNPAFKRLITEQHEQPALARSDRNSPSIDFRVLINDR